MLCPQPRVSWFPVDSGIPCYAQFRLSYHWNEKAVCGELHFGSLLALLIVVAGIHSK